MAFKQLNLAIIFGTLMIAASLPFFESSQAFGLGPSVSQAQAQPAPAATPVAMDSQAGEAAVAPVSVLPVTDQPSEVTDATFFESLSNAIGKMRGATTLGISLLVAQLLIMFSKAPLFGSLFHKVSDPIKMSIVLGLTIVTTVVPLVMQGMDWVAAITSGAGLSAISVFAHQIFKQFFDGKPTSV